METPKSNSSVLKNCFLTCPGSRSGTRHTKSRNHSSGASASRNFGTFERSIGRNVSNDAVSQPEGKMTRCTRGTPC